MSDFEKEVLSRAQDTFVPVAYRDPDGDCLEFIVRREPFHAERVDDTLTVYYGRQTGELVGALIKRVSKLLQEYPGLRLEVRDGRIRLVHLIRARAWRGGDPETVLVYEKLIGIAEESQADTDESELFACA